MESWFHPGTMIQRFCCHQYRSIVQESNTAKCSTKKVYKQVDKRRGEEDAIEPVEHSAVSRQKFAGILYPQVAFDHRFDQITNGSGYGHNRGKNYHEPGAILWENPLHHQGDNNG